MIASCPSGDQLSGYTLGLLSEDTAEQIAEHVEHCPACNETVVALETQPDTVIAILRQTPPADPLSDETACQQALAIIQAYGRNPTGPGRQTEPTAESESAASDLGTIRVYRLLEKLGEGGMGAVYRALHTELDKIVALKVITDQRLAAPQAVARFKREMKAVGKDRKSVV